MEADIVKYEKEVAKMKEPLRQHESKVDAAEAMLASLRQALDQKKARAALQQLEAKVRRAL